MNKLRIRKLGVLSVAKMYAVVCLVISLLFAIPYGLIIIIFALLGAREASIYDAAIALSGGGVVMGVGVMIGLPIFYTIIGFVFGAIGALIYNIFAGIIGGVEIEVENVN